MVFFWENRAPGFVLDFLFRVTIVLDYILFRMVGRGKNYCRDGFRHLGGDQCGKLYDSTKYLNAYRAP